MTWHNHIRVELAWRSSSVMDCHVTAWGSIPYSQGTLDGGAVSKWPRFRWDVKKTTNQPTTEPYKLTVSNICIWRTCVASWNLYLYSRVKISRKRRLRHWMWERLGRCRWVPAPADARTEAGRRSSKSELNSGTPLVRPPVLLKTCDHSRGLAPHKG